GAERSDVLVLDSDLAHASMSCLFADAYPDRFFNLGIAEQNTAGVAAGLAIAGHPVVASGFSIFGACRAYEQIRNSIAYPGLNVTC
ncbi:transketolase family protein, partial [Mycobacterium tuberculosis]|nr:transketolase family protein [Mycobacterium tuberculosis]